MWYKLILPNKHWDGTAASVGGKALHLMQMQQAELPVPDFFILPSETVRQLIQPVSTEVEALLQKMPETPSGVLSSLSQELQMLIKNVPFPQTLCSEIKGMCNFLFGESHKLAVRSSAILEDGLGHSFAGLHETFLNVSSEDLMECIMSCVVSVYKEEALSYLSKPDINFSL